MLKTYFILCAAECHGSSWRSAGIVFGGKKLIYLSKTYVRKIKMCLLSNEFIIEWLLYYFDCMFKLNVDVQGTRKQEVSPSL